MHDILFFAAILTITVGPFIIANALLDDDFESPDQRHVRKLRETANSLRENNKKLREISDSIGETSDSIRENNKKLRETTQKFEENINHLISLRKKRREAKKIKKET
jgi:peptidoglycan hydrolase CwlO-like protein